MYKGDPCLIIPDLKGGQGSLRLLNVNNLAKKFASINKAMTIILFDACREKLDDPKF
jgi:hypothetical protein